MAIPTPSLSVPLYPGAGYRDVQSPQDVAHLLSQIAAAPHAGLAQEALVQLNRALGEGNVRLSHIVAGQTSHPDSFRLALSEIAANPKSLATVLKDPTTIDSLNESAQGIILDVSPIGAEIEEWRRQTGDTRKRPLPRGLINKILPSTAAATAIGGLLLGPLGAVASGAGTVLLRSGQYFIEREAQILESADQSSLELIRRRLSGGEPQKKSLWNTLKFLFGFQESAALCLQKLREDPSSYDLYSSNIAPIALGRLGHEVIVLNAHNLDRIETLRRQGKNILFVANHQSNLDVLCLITLLKKFGPRFLAKIQLAGTPTLGAILKEIDHMFVDQENPDVIGITRWAIQTSQSGRCSVYFMEGSRRQTDRRYGEVGFLPPELGAVFAASKISNSVIVPIAIAGTGMALPKQDSKDLKWDARRMLSGGKIILSILDPIDMSAYFNPLENEKTLKIPRAHLTRATESIWYLMHQEIRHLQAWLNHENLAS